MSHQDRREPLPKCYQFGDANPDNLFRRYLDENFKDAERFEDPFNASQTLANIVDDAAMRAAYSQFHN